jgi:hypothetical protein
MGDLKIVHYSAGGIGRTTKVVCGCGEEYNITDYDSW